MEREGAIALLPAPLSETPRSEGPKKYIRNVEAEGSSLSPPPKARSKA